MIGDLWTVLLTSAEESFTQVTVFVGAVLLLFGYIDWQQGLLSRLLQAQSDFNPLSVHFGDHPGYRGLHPGNAPLCERDRHLWHGGGHPYRHGG